MKDKKTIFMAYTDASSYNNGRRAHPNEPENSCSAGVVVLDHTIVYSFHNYNPDTTISYGELYAIYTLLKEFTPLIYDTNCRLVLHTDSEYCFKSITQWYRNWKKNSIAGIWQTPRGPVPYQEMLEEIINMVKESKSIIKHVSGGHFDVLDESKLYLTDKWGDIIEGPYGPIPRKPYKDAILTCQKRYLRNNGEKISQSQAAYHMFFNNICDQIAKAGLEYGMDGSISYEPKRKSFKKFID